MKSFLLFLPLLLLGHHVWAQGFRFGLKAGANSSLYYEYNNVAGERLLGFNGGALARYTVDSEGMLSAQAELLYSGKGARYKLKDSRGHLQSYTSRLHYLDVPLLLHLHPFSVFSVEVGPQLSCVLGGKNGLPNPGLSISPGPFQRSNYKPVQLGAVLGAGVDATPGLGLTFRYCIDRTGIGTTEKLAYFRNSVFQLQMSYTFDHQKKAGD